MTYRVGSARISENGNAGWDGKAKAGDQTGKEVSEQNFYVHSKGWYVFRFKDPTHAIAAAKQMISACNNPHIGYDQSQRGTLRNQLLNNNYTDISQVSTDCETDCSALVRECVRLATGVDVGNIRTVSMPDMMPKSGLFEPMTKYEKGMKLYTGDILVTCTSGHTVIVTEGESRTVTTVAQDFVQYKVEITASVLNIRKGPSTKYAVVGTLNKGHKVTIREESNGWGKVVCYPDSAPKTIAKGWISLKYTKH